MATSTSIYDLFTPETPRSTSENLWSTPQIDSLRDSASDGHGELTPPSEAVIQKNVEGTLPDVNGTPVLQSEISTPVSTKVPEPEVATETGTATQNNVANQNVTLNEDLFPVLNNMSNIEQKDERTQHLIESVRAYNNAQSYTRFTYANNVNVDEFRKLANDVSDTLWEMYGSAKDSASVDRMYGYIEDTIIAELFNKPISEIEKNKKLYRMMLMGEDVDSKTFLQAYGDSFKTNLLHWKASYNQLLYDFTDDETYLEKKDGYNDQILKLGDYTGRDGFAKFAVKSAPITAQGLGLAVTMIASEIIGIGAGVATGGMLLKDVFTKATLINILKGTGTSATVGKVANAVVDTFIREWGSLSSEMFEMEDADGKKMDKSVRMLASFVGGALNAVIEYFTEDPISGSFKKLDWAEKLSETVFADIVKDSVVTTALNFGTRQLAGAFSESVEEFLQSLTGDITKHVGAEYSNLFRGGNDFDSGSLYEWMDNALNSFGEAFIPSLFVGFLGAGKELSLDIASEAITDENFKKNAMDEIRRAIGRISSPEGIDRNELKEMRKNQKVDNKYETVDIKQVQFGDKMSKEEIEAFEEKHKGEVLPKVKVKYDEETDSFIPVDDDNRQIARYLYQVKKVDNVAIEVDNVENRIAPRTFTNLYRASGAILDKENTETISFKSENALQRFISRAFGLGMNVVDNGDGTASITYKDDLGNDHTYTAKVASKEEIKANKKDYVNVDALIETLSDADREKWQGFYNELKEAKKNIKEDDAKATALFLSMLPDNVIRDLRANAGGDGLFTTTSKVLSQYQPGSDEYKAVEKAIKKGNAVAYHGKQIILNDTTNAKKSVSHEVFHMLAKIYPQYVNNVASALYDVMHTNEGRYAMKQFYMKYRSWLNTEGNTNGVDEKNVQGVVHTWGQFKRILENITPESLMAEMNDKNAIPVQEEALTRIATVIFNDPSMEAVNSLPEKLRDAFWTLAKKMHELFSWMTGREYAPIGLERSVMSIFDTEYEYKPFGSNRLALYDSEYESLNLNKHGGFEFETVEDFVKFVSNAPYRVINGVKVISGIKDERNLPYKKELVMADYIGRLFNTSPKVFSRFMDIHEWRGDKSQSKSPDGINAVADGRLIEFKSTTGNLNTVSNKIVDGLKKSDDVFVVTTNDMSNKENYEELINLIKIKTDSIEDKKGSLLIVLDKKTGILYAFDVKKEGPEGSLRLARSSTQENLRLRSEQLNYNISEELDKVGSDQITMEDYLNAEEIQESKESVDKVKTNNYKTVYENELDNEYMDAVNSGDIDKAREMVAQRAKELGFEDAIPEHGASYRIHVGPEPKTTITAYKTFFVDENGRPSALFVNGVDVLPMGVTLDATEAWNFVSTNGKRYVPTTVNPNADEGTSKTGTSAVIPNDEVRQELIKRGFLPEGSKAKAVTAVAYRPDWHAGDEPFFPQGGKRGNARYTESGKPNKNFDPSKPETNYQNVHKWNQVVFEVELGADIDYTKSHKNSSGNTVYEDYDYIPKGGFYKYATNPMMKDDSKGAWMLSDTLKIVRALSEEECNEILAKDGFKPQEWEGGAMSLDKLGYTGPTLDAMRKTLAPITYDDNGDVIPLSKRFDSSINDIRYEEELDGEYLEALENDDMDKVQRMVDSMAVKKGYFTKSEYRMAHRAPYHDPYDGNKNLPNAFNDELMPSNALQHPEWYFNMREPSSRQSFRAVVDALRNYQRDGHATIKMYRSVIGTVEEGKFRNGDWITPSRIYAQMNGELENAPYRIIEQEVNVEDCWWNADSINEWGYDDGNAYAYKNTENNIKLMDAVTYDDDGNVIPLSQRFNEDNSDTRYEEELSSNGEDYDTYSDDANLSDMSEQGIIERIKNNIYIPQKLLDKFDNKFTRKEKTDRQSLDRLTHYPYLTREYNKVWDANKGKYGVELGSIYADQIPSSKKDQIMENYTASFTDLARSAKTAEEFLEKVLKKTGLDKENLTDQQKSLKKEWEELGEKFWSYANTLTPEQYLTFFVNSFLPRTVTGATRENILFLKKISEPRQKLVTTKGGKKIYKTESIESSFINLTADLNENSSLKEFKDFVSYTRQLISEKPRLLDYYVKEFAKSLLQYYSKADKQNIAGKSYLFRQSSLLMMATGLDDNEYLAKLNTLQKERDDISQNAKDRREMARDKELLISEMRAIMDSMYDELGTEQEKRVYSENELTKLKKKYDAKISSDAKSLDKLKELNRQLRDEMKKLQQSDRKEMRELFRVYQEEIKAFQDEIDSMIRDDKKGYSRIRRLEKTYKRMKQRLDDLKLLQRIKNEDMKYKMEVLKAVHKRQLWKIREAQSIKRSMTWNRTRHDAVIIEPVMRWLYAYITGKNYLEEMEDYDKDFEATRVSEKTEGTEVELVTYEFEYDEGMDSNYSEIGNPTVSKEGDEEINAKTSMFGKKDETNAPGFKDFDGVNVVAKEVPTNYSGAHRTSEARRIPDAIAKLLPKHLVDGIREGLDIYSYQNLEPEELHAIREALAKVKAVANSSKALKDAQKNDKRLFFRDAITSQIFSRFGIDVYNLTDAQKEAIKKHKNASYEHEMTDEEIADYVVKHPEVILNLNDDKSKEKLEKFKELMRDVRMATIKMDRECKLLDGSEDGSLTRYFFRPIWDAYENFTANRRRRYAEASEVFFNIISEGLGKKQFRVNNKLMTEYSTGHDYANGKHLDFTDNSINHNRIYLTNWEKLGIYIYAKNIYSLRKLVGKTNISLETVAMINPDAVLKFAKVALAERRINANNEDMKKDILYKCTTEELTSIMERIVAGEFAESVMPSFAKNLGDEMVRLVGQESARMIEAGYNEYNTLMIEQEDYFPLAMARSNVSRMNEQNTRKNVNRGAIMNRSMYADYELILNPMAVFYAGIDDQEMLINMASVINDSNWLLDGKGGNLKQILSDVYGEEHADYFEDFLRRMAGISDNTLLALEKKQLDLLSNIAVSRIGASLPVMLKQTVSMIPAYFKGELTMNDIWFAMALINSDKVDPQSDEGKTFKETTAEFIEENSPSTFYSAYNEEAEKAKMFDQTVGADARLAEFREATMIPVEWMDGLVKKIVWLAKYKHEMDKHGIHSEAVYNATQLIQTTQSVTDKPSQAPLQAKTDTWSRLTFMFTNDLFQTWNYLEGDIPVAWKNKQWRKVAKLGFSIALSAMAMGFFAGGWLPDDDDDEDKKFDVKDYARDVLLEGLNDIPYAGLFLSTAFKGYTKNTYNGLDSLVNLVGAITEDDKGKKSKSKKSKAEKIIDSALDVALEGVGTLKGIPVTTLQRFQNAIEAVAPSFSEGWTANDLNALWYFLGSNYGNGLYNRD